MHRTIRISVIFVGRTVETTKRMQSQFWLHVDRGPPFQLGALRTCLLVNPVLKNTNMLQTILKSERELQEKFFCVLCHLHSIILCFPYPCAP